MSRLYASIDSDARKTVPTSRGFKRIDTHTRGWDSGVRVVARVEDEQDVFDVYATGGSNGGTSDKLVATISGGQIKIGAATYTLATMF